LSQISAIIEERVKALGGNQSAIARQLGIPSQRLSQYINGRQKPKVEFYDKWQEVFGEDLRAPKPETNVTTAMKHPNGYQEKYIRLLEEELENYKRKLGDAVGRIETNLTFAANNVVAGRAEIRAAIDYTVMKDSQGSEKKRVVLMEQINKLIHLQLTGGGGVGIGQD
jgi:transcriptional regulator with XRE-family HTH domain